MNNTYIKNWESVKGRFEQWWDRQMCNKPLMHIVASNGKTATTQIPNESDTENAQDKYVNVQRIIAGYRNFFETHSFLADAFPVASIDLGAGSMALYLGGEPIFKPDTVWYKEKFSNADEFRLLSFDENNYWWKTHQSMMKEARELAKGDFFVAIPDIIENLDILSALRGPQNLCYDIMDNPQAVHDGLKIIDDNYFNYYDRCYELLSDDDSSSVYTYYQILGKGKVAKLQCDFNVCISQETFREYVIPSLTKQCRYLDRSIFHLDGPDAIRHIPALMEINELNALQWTPGWGNPDGGSANWYHIYDQVKDAGKGFWISFEDSGPKDWAENAKKLVKRYGATGMYFIFPVFKNLNEAQEMAALFD